MNFFFTSVPDRVAEEESRPYQGIRTHADASPKTVLKTYEKRKVQNCSIFRVAQSVGHLTRKSGVLGSIPGLATYFRFSFRFFKKGSYQLLAKVRARSTG